MQKVKDKIVPIKVKLLTIIIPAVIIAMIVLIGISYSISKDLILDYSSSLLNSSIENQANEIESWLNENLAAFQMAKNVIETTSPDDEELQKILDGYYGTNDNCAEGLYVADETGKMITATNSTKKESNPCESVWYKDGLSRWNMGVTEAYTNSDGTAVISATGLLNDNSDKVKVISADLALERVSIIVNSYIEMDKAEAILVSTQNDEILAHRDMSLISTKLNESSDSFFQDIAKKIDSEDYAIEEINDNLVGMSEVAGTDWIVVSYIPQNVVYSGINQVRTTMVLICIISIILMSILIERVVHAVIKPVKELTAIITDMTNGDFTIDVNTKRNDEIGVMSNHVEKFIDSMRNMISSIHTVSDRINKQANNSDYLSTQMYDASKLQTESMKELNSTVEQLSVSVNVIAEHATTLAMVVSETRENGDQVNQCMTNTVEVSQQGKEDIQSISNAMNEIKDSVQKLKVAIDKVGIASGEITNITSVIGEIAEQTNLLSLNASIEAARAGEAGKGFAVVATEIGQLAKTSTDSVRNIEGLITEISSLVLDTVKQTDESVENINRSSGLVENALNTFDVIFENINEVSDLVKEMIDKVQKVDEVASNVAAISEEQAASSQEILATSETMVQQSTNITTNSQEVSNDAETLTRTSEELNEQVAIFKIEKGE